MKTNQREILIYYNPESSSDRQTVAHAKSIVPYIKRYSFKQAPITATIWRQILESLNLHPKEILNKAHPYYQANIRGREFDEEGWIHVLQHNPDIIKAPIAIRGRTAILCLTPTDIYKLHNEKAPV